MKLTEQQVVDVVRQQQRQLGRRVRTLELWDRFAVEHGIAYSIDYGTLLGAVRHGGMIPWDDDLDVRADWKSLAPVVQSSPLHTVGGVGLTFCTMKFGFIQTRIDDVKVDVFLNPSQDDHKRLDPRLYAETAPLRFESLLLPAPTKYHEVLTHVYGDRYMLDCVITNHQYTRYYDARMASTLTCIPIERVRELLGSIAPIEPDNEDLRVR